MPPRSDPVRRSWRGRLLNAAFQLLYGPLSALHEPIGRLGFGAAWHARRLAILDLLPLQGPILDLGCGEGRLLTVVESRGIAAIGLDPSKDVARRARRRGGHVAVATAQAMPFREAMFAAVICTYPGPWIAERATWDEIARVTAPSAIVVVLLGGAYTRGPWWRLRSVLTRIAYGAPEASVPADILRHFGHDFIDGAMQRRDDAWGSAFLWVGHRT